MILDRPCLFLCLPVLLAAAPGRAFFEEDQAWDSGARSLGLGGSYSGLAQGTSNHAGNPAALAWEERASLEAGAGSLAGGEAAGSLRGIMPRIQGAAFALGWTGFRRSGDLPGGEARVGADAALHLDPAKRVAAGAGLRYHWGRDLGQKWGARSLELGLLAKLAVPAVRPLSLGVSLGRLGAVSRSASGLEVKEPARVSAGLGWNFVPEGILAIDLVSWDRGGGGPSVKTGFEYGFRNRTILLRTGYSRTPAASRWCAGAGWRNPDWAVDYGLALDQGGESRHLASFSYFLRPFSFQSDALPPGSADPSRIRELEERIARLRQAQADLAQRADANLAESRKLTEKYAALQSQYAALQAAATKARSAPVPVPRAERPRARTDADRGPDSDFLTGKQLYDQERYKDAFEAFGRAFDRNPADAQTRQYIVDCLQKIPKEDLYPQEFLDLYNQGIGFNTQGAFEEEIKVWQNFLATYPKDLRVEGFLREAEERLRRIKGGP